MTVDALDLDRGLVLGDQLGSAVHVLAEVTIDAVHALFGMNVFQVDRPTEVFLGVVEVGRPLLVETSLVELGPIERQGNHALELVRVVEIDLSARGIEEVPLAVHLENGAENPAVAVVVGKLGLLELRVDHGGDIAQKLSISPSATRRRLLGVPREGLHEFRVRWVFLRRGPHVVPVGLVTPHREAEVGVQERIRLVVMARHALARRNGRRELVDDGMAGFVRGDLRVHAEGLPGIPEAGVALPRVHRAAVVGVHHVASGAAARAVVSRLVVRPHER